jgi:predicted Zn finger-like uncharacterized protein
MVITCPNCSTQFNLADERYMPGRKARCSVCSYIFVLMAQVDDNEVPSVPSAPSTEVPLGGSPAGVASKEQLIRTTDKKKNKPAAPKEKTGGTLKKI